MRFFEGSHRRQLDGSALASENCTPTSGANGARASTGGRVDKSGGEIRALLAKQEETDPDTPGWSLGDLRRAKQRLGVPYRNRTGRWADVEAALRSGLFVVLQGDSDQFPDATCSGAFDGDHAVGLHPGDGADGTWLLADPLCTARRRERGAVLRAYAEKLAGGPTFRFGVFTTPVPREDDVNITAVKGEDWKPREGPPGHSNGVIRATPDRTAPILVRLDLGTVVRTIAEIEAAGERWRLTEHDGAPAYLLRSDWDPIVQGGDPAVDARLDAYIARTSG
ncbi:MAG: hypothetical protein AB1736_07635 [Chloroflexota bacterium]